MNDIERKVYLTGMTPWIGELLGAFGIDIKQRAICGFTLKCEAVDQLVTLEIAEHPRTADGSFTIHEGKLVQLTSKLMLVPMEDSNGG